MYYTLYGIDNVNKVIYIKIENRVVNNELLLNFNNDYQRILKYASENNYTIQCINELTNNYTDNFSFKRSL